MEFGWLTTHWANWGLSGCNYFLKAANINGLFAWNRVFSWGISTASLPIWTLLKLAHHWCWSVMISTILILTHQSYGSFGNFFQRLSRRPVDIVWIKFISVALQCHHILMSFIIYLDLCCHFFMLLLNITIIIVKIVWWNIAFSFIAESRWGGTLL